MYAVKNSMYKILCVSEHEYTVFKFLLIEYNHV